MSNHERSLPIVEPPNKIDESVQEVELPNQEIYISTKDELLNKIDENAHEVEDRLVNFISCFGKSAARSSRNNGPAHFIKKINQLLLT
jgi:hypothetical protein